MYIERADILYSVELRDQLHNSTYSLMRFSLYLLTAIGVDDERFSGVDGLAVGRYVQSTMKCEDHG